MSEPSQRPPRLTTFPAFDGFRGYGVMIVLFTHFPQVVDSNFYNVAWQVNQASKIGYMALDVFFVMSGFFITRLLLRERQTTGRISFLNFYVRRSLRIFPIYYLAVLVSYVVFRFNSSELLSLLTYTFNFYHPFHPMPNPLEHTWSLSVEEQFYFGWPLLIVLLPLRLAPFVTGRVMPAIAICCGIAISVMVGTDDNMLAGNLVYMTCFTRMMALSFGGWLAFREFENRPLRGWPCVIMLGTAAVVLVLDRVGRDKGIITSQGIYWTIALCAYAMISVAFTSTIVFDRGRLWRWMNAVLCIPLARGLGHISYALYLYHLPVLFYFGLNDAAMAGGKAHVSQVALVLAITLALATVSYFAIERPLQRVRHRGERKPAPSLSQPDQVAAS